MERITDPATEQGQSDQQGNSTAAQRNRLLAVLHILVIVNTYSG